MKKVIVLGASGSIGKSAIDILLNHRDEFELVGASVYSNESFLESLIKDWPKLRTALCKSYTNKPNVHYLGDDSSIKLVEENDADIVIHGISGAAGLSASFATINTGKTLALANKESIVMAGPLILQLAKEKNTQILPVDSEHSAIFHILSAFGHKSCREIILTASGGPFRTYDKEKLLSVTVEDALRHPTWKMGDKISIDSATMANKGLEVIEAVHLFSMSPDTVKVLVHPQSKIHSLVRMHDGSLYAQISEPDMRLPIYNALNYPECKNYFSADLDLSGHSLSFEKPNTDNFPMLSLAYAAIRAGGSYPLAYNAANEIAVELFRKTQISFMQIGILVSEVLEADWSMNIKSLNDIIDMDQKVRRVATVISQSLEGIC